MVNNLGDGVILPVTDVKPVEGGLEVVHDECGNTIDYTPNTLLFRVRTLGFRFDPTTRRLVYREGREGGGEEVKEVPVAFDMERFEIHYVYEGAFGDTVTDPPGGAFTPGYDFARPTGAPRTRSRRWPPERSTPLGASPWFWKPASPPVDAR